VQRKNSHKRKGGVKKSRIQREGGAANNVAAENGGKMRRNGRGVLGRPKGEKLSIQYNRQLKKVSNRKGGGRG